VNKHRGLPCENLKVVIGIAEYIKRTNINAVQWIDGESKRAKRKETKRSDEIEIVFQFRAVGKERERWVILKISTAVDRHKRNASDLAER